MQSSLALSMILGAWVGLAVGEEGENDVSLLQFTVDVQEQETQLDGQRREVSSSQSIATATTGALEELSVDRRSLLSTRDESVDYEEDDDEDDEDPSTISRNKKTKSGKGRAKRSKKSRRRKTRKTVKKPAKKMPVKRPAKAVVKNAEADEGGEVSMSPSIATANTGALEELSVDRRSLLSTRDESVDYEEDDDEDDEDPSTISRNKKTKSGKGRAKKSKKSRRRKTRKTVKKPAKKMPVKRPAKAVVKKAEADEGDEESISPSIATA